MEAKKALIVEEAMTPGHPDELADLISDAALDWVLERDPRAVAHFDATVGLKTVAITASMKSGVSSQKVERALPGLVKDVLRSAGYFDGRWGLDPENCHVVTQWAMEEPETTPDEPRTVFGHAEAGLPGLIPIPVHQAREMAQSLFGLLCEGGQTWIGPACRVQLQYTFVPRGLRKLQKVILHVPLEAGLDPGYAEELLSFWVLDFNLRAGWKDKGVDFVLNPDGPPTLD
jgi:S-adenosylmethionine synthetase